MSFGGSSKTAVGSQLSGDEALVWRYVKPMERYMALEGIIIWLIIGAIAGWLAGQIIKGGGFGLAGNIVLGIIGAVVAGWLLPRLGLYIGGGLLGDIVNATIGALLVIFVVGLIARN